ncbi:MAG: phosphotransferase [Deltaproteobacteria bacterium]|nr:phosphotransferase [Deltaproteobacteria bacterium]
MPQDLQSALAHLLKNTPHSSPFTVAKLAGEASYREYFRLDFGAGKTLICMKMPKGYSSVSEEVTKSSKKITELPFINVQRYLKSLSLPVPEIILYSPGNGILILEDLGDESLERALSQGDMPSCYEKAIALLAQMQKKTRERPSADCVASYKKFDEELLVWELKHFLEYGIEDRLGIKVPDNDRIRFLDFFSTLAYEIVRMPQGFVHRDYQSRNLILKNNALHVIDFQDALTGPVLYDLVALLRDSYISIPLPLRTALIKFYLQNVDVSHPYHGKEKEAFDHFDLITIQRKLKDTGRFQYIKTVKGNPNFLKNVPASLEYVKEALGRQKKVGELGSLIAKYIPL